MRGGGILGLLALGFIGVIIADVLAHPRGVSAFGNSANHVLESTYSAMLGRNP